MDKIGTPDFRETIVQPLEVKALGNGLMEKLRRENPDVYALFADRKNLFELARIASLARLRVPYQTVSGDVFESPVDYTIRQEMFIHLKDDLYITPISESFKRHRIFRKINGRYYFVTEFKIPGQHPTRQFTVFDDVDIYDRLQRTYGDDCPMADFIGSFIEYDTQDLWLYDKLNPLSEPLEVVLYGRSSKSGPRLENVSSTDIHRIAQHYPYYRGSVERVVKDVLRDVIRFMAMAHQAGLVGQRGKNNPNGSDLHDGNWCLTFGDDKLGPTIPVGDFSSLNDPKDNIKNRIDDPATTEDDLRKLYIQFGRVWTEGMGVEISMSWFEQVYREELIYTELIKRERVMSQGLAAEESLAISGARAAAAVTQGSDELFVAAQPAGGRMALSTIQSTLITVLSGIKWSDLQAGNIPKDKKGVIQCVGRGIEYVVFQSNIGPLKGKVIKLPLAPKTYIIPAQPSEMEREEILDELVLGNKAVATAPVTIHFRSSDPSKQGVTITVLVQEEVKILGGVMNDSHTTLQQKEKLIADLADYTISLWRLKAPLFDADLRTFDNIGGDFEKFQQGQYGQEDLRLVDTGLVYRLPRAMDAREAVIKNAEPNRMSIGELLVYNVLIKFSDETVGSDPALVGAYSKFLRKLFPYATANDIQKAREVFVKAGAVRGSNVKLPLIRDAESHRILETLIDKLAVLDQGARMAAAAPFTPLQAKTELDRVTSTFAYGEKWVRDQIDKAGAVWDRIRQLDNSLEKERQRSWYKSWGRAGRIRQIQDDLKQQKAELSLLIQGAAPGDVSAAYEFLDREAALARAGA
ncbi:MAG: hypothetical protein WCG06_03920, partial [Candidatus Omnitrophota bacterium]